MIILFLTACTGTLNLFDKCLTLNFRSGVSVANKESLNANSAKKADETISAIMNEIYQALLDEVKEYQSINDKFGECATAEYNNGKIYKILAYSKKEVLIAAKTLQESQSYILDTGILSCSMLDEECYKLTLIEQTQPKQHFKGQQALDLMKEYFEMDMSF